MRKRSFNEGSMDTSSSQTSEPVCNGLRMLFEPLVAEPLPVDLTRLMDALDDAFSRGELFAHPNGRRTTRPV